jgi:Asp-tRNA(Asn)/Glu-tRNA(Gln) amidotransferase C subunit
MATKKELANLAINLFNNIHQADQFDVERMFYHLDNKFLLRLIEEMRDDVLYNIEHQHEYILNSEEEITEIFAMVNKVLG